MKKWIFNNRSKDLAKFDRAKLGETELRSIKGGFYVCIIDGKVYIKA